MLYPAELRAQNARNISSWNRKNPAPMRTDVMDAQAVGIFAHIVGLSECARAGK